MELIAHLIHDPDRLARHLQHPLLAQLYFLTHGERDADHARNAGIRDNKGQIRKVTAEDARLAIYHRPQLIAALIELDIAPVEGGEGDARIAALVQRAINDNGRAHRLAKHLVNNSKICAGVALNDVVRTGGDVEILELNQQSRSEADHDPENADDDDHLG